MEQVWQSLAKAIDTVVGGGPWAAMCILLLALNVWLIRNLLREGASNRTAAVQGTIVLTRLTTLIERLPVKSEPGP